MNEHPTGRDLVFIVGAPRSGTTWLQRLLATHPQIRTGQESNVFSSYIGPLVRAWQREFHDELLPHKATGRGGVGLPCYLTAEEFVEILRNYLSRLLAGVTKDLGPQELFLEKTPEHALFLREIVALLPESRIIHIVRDPRDVVSSLLAVSRTWGRAWAPKTAGAAAERWVRHVAAARWTGAKLSAARYREIRYEDLLMTPDEGLSGLARFLNIEWNSDAIRRAVERNRPESIRTGSGTPIRVGGEWGKRGVSTVTEPEAFVRVGQRRSWKADLSFSQKVRVWKRVRRLMTECGYKWTARDWLW